MKAELNIDTQELIREITQEVIRALKPLLSNKAGEDVIFDKKGLSQYLHVSESTINKLVSNKQIPYFKINAGQSGGVRFQKSSIDRWIARHTIPEINQITGKIRQAVNG